jgi:phosphate transport system permease protein
LRFQGPPVKPLPLLFTAFGSRFVSYQLTGPMASLPVQIYTYAISPFEDWQRQAWGGAFVLIVLVLGTNLLARAFVNWRRILNAFTKEKIS